MNQTKSFDSGLKKNMRKATHSLGGVVSSNPRRWRGEQLHHHGGGVCWLFVLLWIDSWRHKLIVCKKMYKNNPIEGFCGVTFWPTLPCTAPSVSKAGEVMMTSSSQNEQILTTNSILPNKDPLEGKTATIVAVMRGRPKHSHCRQCSNKHYKKK